MSTTPYTDLNTNEDGEPQKGNSKLTIAVLATSALAIGAVTFVLRGGAADSPSPPSARLPSVPSRGSASPGTRLRISNGCASDPLWLANFAFQTPYFEQDIMLEGGGSHDFAIPQKGLASTRFWPKWGCDSDGMNCRIGGSGGPGEGCIAEGCAPAGRARSGCSSRAIFEN